MQSSSPLAHGERAALVATAEAIEREQESAELPNLSVSQIALYSLGGVTSGLVFTMMNNALPLYLATYRMPFGVQPFFKAGDAIPATIVATLTNERSLVGGLIQPLVGRMSDRTHSPLGKRRPYILVGGMLTALLVALLALHPPFWLMAAVVTLTGVALYIAVGPYTALLADIAPGDQRGRIGGVMALGGVLGAVVFAVLSLLLWESARGWVFVLTAVGIALTIAGVVAGVREPATNVASGTVTQEKQQRQRSLLAEVLRHRPLAIYTVAMGVYWLGAGAATPFITRFGVIELGIPEASSFSLLLVVIVSTAVGAVIAGVLADKVGRKRILLPSLVLFAVATIAGSQVHNLAEALPIMVLVGLSNAGPSALYLPILADLVPRREAGALMGFSNMVWSVAQPIGSLIAGLLVDASGSYRGVFFFAGVCMAVAAIVLSGVRVRTIDDGGMQS